MWHIARRRVIFLQIPPEHVLHAICSIEDTSAQSLLRFVQRIKQHPLAIFVIAVSLRQKRIVIEHMLVHSPRIFRQSKRCVRPEKFGQINGVSHGMRDRQIRVSRVNIHRRDIDLNFRRKFLQIKTANPVCGEAHAGLELRGDPLGIFPNFQNKLFRTDCEASLLRSQLRLNLEVHPHFARVFSYRVIRPRNIRSANSIRALNRHPDATFAKLVARRTRGAQTERPLAALEIRHAHSREQHALKLFRRKRNWNSYHRTEYSGIAQPVPEWSPLPHRFDLSLAEWNGIFSNLDMPLWPLDFGRR